MKILHQKITNMNLSKIQEIFNAYAVMVDPTSEQSEIAAQRLETCNSCPFVMEIPIRICGQCGCVLRAKAFSKDKTACPENKWEI
jgi:hypothetical protein